MRKVIVLFFLISFCAGVGKALYFLKDGFSLRRIHSLNYPASEDWDEEADFALSQTFHYIGRGRQCFAFESDDKKYVLKFPRTDIYKTPFWVRVLPVESYRKRLEANHLAHEKFILASFDISFHELRNQTGLIAMHLGQSQSKGRVLVVIDKVGCKHFLPLEKTSFVLQRKRPILMKAFSRALEKGDRAQARKILDAFVSAVVERAEKGILNRDRSFLRNYGFDGEKAYQIDVGSFFRNPGLDHQTAFRKSFFDSMDPVQEWLAQKDLEMLNYLNSQIEPFQQRHAG